MVGEEDVFQLVHELGWQAHPLDRGLSISRHGESDPLYCTTNTHWCAFECPVLAANALDGAYEAEVQRYLLGLNDRMYLAKFYLDGERNVILGAEVPMGAALRSLAPLAVQAIHEYARQYVPLVRTRFARDRAPIPPLEDEEPRPSLSMSSRQVGIAESLMALWINSLYDEGWHQYHPHSGQVWPLVYTTPFRGFSCYVTTTPLWTYFQVPLAALSRSREPSALVLRAVTIRYLLRLNDLLFSAKVGVSPSDDVVLTLEWPTAAFDYSLFLQATRIMAYCLDTFNQELQLMSALDADRQLADFIVKAR